ncbi:MAG: APC family permease [Polyangiaceae bacterium]|nr:APC family permease [Polyangiaceae bacterium]
MTARKLGLWSGVGLTMADMVGVGVLTTAGFMALDLSPRLILLDWLLGGLLAVCGSLAYARLAWMVPRSGGEYRYLSSMLHPAVGYFAGWTSLLVGFSVPVALAALGAGAFGETVLVGADGRLIAAALIVGVTIAHAVGLRAAKWTQDLLAATKAVLIVAFIALGITFGTNRLPEWTPADPEAGFPLRAFFTSLIFITFCYTGWNAATYASEEFENPRRDVPRAMLVGCLIVTGLYLVVNWVFVTNLTQSDLSQWIKGDTDRVTLAHLVVKNLLGSRAAVAMSIVVMIALTSAISAMTLIGPRVYAAMAADHFLPSVLAARAGKPPIGSLVLQCSLATSLVFLSGFRELLNNVGSILAIVSAITVLSLFRRRRWRRGERPPLSAMIGALAYAGMSAWMVWFSIQSSKRVDVIGFGVPTVVLWMIGIFVVAMAAYGLTRALRPDAGAAAPRRNSDRSNEGFVAVRASMIPPGE